MSDERKEQILVESPTEELNGFLTRFVQKHGTEAARHQKDPYYAEAQQVKPLQETLQDACEGQSLDAARVNVLKTLRNLRCRVDGRSTSALKPKLLDFITKVRKYRVKELAALVSQVDENEVLLGANEECLKEVRSLEGQIKEVFESIELKEQLIQAEEETRAAHKEFQRETEVLKSVGEANQIKERDLEKSAKDMTHQSYVIALERNQDYKDYLADRPKIVALSQYYKEAIDLFYADLDKNIEVLKARRERIVDLEALKRQLEGRIESLKKYGNKGNSDFKPKDISFIEVQTVPNETAKSIEPITVKGKEVIAWNSNRTLAENLKSHLTAYRKRGGRFWPFSRYISPDRRASAQWMQTFLDTNPTAKNKQIIDQLIDQMKRIDSSGTNGKPSYLYRLYETALNQAMKDWPVEADVIQQQSEALKKSKDELNGYCLTLKEDLQAIKNVKPEEADKLLKKQIQKHKKSTSEWERRKKLIREKLVLQVKQREEYKVREALGTLKKDIKETFSKCVGTIFERTEKTWSSEQSLIDIMKVHFDKFSAQVCKEEAELMQSISQLENELAELDSSFEKSLPATADQTDLVWRQPETLTLEINVPKPISLPLTKRQEIRNQAFARANNRLATYLEGLEVRLEKRKEKSLEFSVLSADKIDKELMEKAKFQAEINLKREHCAWIQELVKEYSQQLGIAFDQFGLIDHLTQIQSKWPDSVVLKASEPNAEIKSPDSSGDILSEQVSIDELHKTLQAKRLNSSLSARLSQSKERYQQRMEETIYLELCAQRTQAKKDRVLTQFEEQLEEKQTSELNGVIATTNLLYSKIKQLDREALSIANNLENPRFREHLDKWSKKRVIEEKNNKKDISQDFERSLMETIDAFNTVNKNPGAPFDTPWTEFLEDIDIAVDPFEDMLYKLLFFLDATQNLDHPEHTEVKEKTRYLIKHYGDRQAARLYERIFPSDEPLSLVDLKRPPYYLFSPYDNTEDFCRKLLRDLNDALPYLSQADAKLLDKHKNELEKNLHVNEFKKARDQLKQLKQDNINSLTPDMFKALTDVLVLLNELIEDGKHDFHKVNEHLSEILKSNVFVDVPTLSQFFNEFNKKVSHYSQVPKCQKIVTDQYGTFFYRALNAAYHRSARQRAVLVDLARESVHSIESSSFRQVFDAFKEAAKPSSLLLSIKTLCDPEATLRQTIVDVKRLEHIAFKRNRIDIQVVENESMKKCIDSKKQLIKEMKVEPVKRKRIKRKGQYPLVQYFEQAAERHAKQVFEAKRVAAQTKQLQALYKEYVKQIEESMECLLDVEKGTRKFSRPILLRSQKILKLAKYTPRIVLRLLKYSKQSEDLGHLLSVFLKKEEPSGTLQPPSAVTLPDYSNAFAQLKKEQANYPPHPPAYYSNRHRSLYKKARVCINRWNLTMRSLEAREGELTVLNNEKIMLEKDLLEKSQQLKTVQQQSQARVGANTAVELGLKHNKPLTIQALDESLANLHLAQKELEQSFEKETLDPVQLIHSINAIDDYLLYFAKCIESEIPEFSNRIWSLLQEPLVAEHFDFDKDLDRLQQRILLVNYALKHLFVFQNEFLVDAPPELKPRTLHLIESAKKVKESNALAQPPVLEKTITDLEHQKAQTKVLQAYANGLERTLRQPQVLTRSAMQHTQEAETRNKKHSKNLHYEKLEKKIFHNLLNNNRELAALLVLMVKQKKLENQCRVLEDEVHSYKKEIARFLVQLDQSPSLHQTVSVMPTDPKAAFDHAFLISTIQAKRKVDQLNAYSEKANLEEEAALKAEVEVEIRGKLGRFLCERLSQQDKEVKERDDGSEFSLGADSIPYQLGAFLSSVKDEPKQLRRSIQDLNAKMEKLQGDVASLKQLAKNAAQRSGHPIVCEQVEQAFSSDASWFALERFKQLTDTLERGEPLFSIQPLSPQLDVKCVWNLDDPVECMLRRLLTFLEVYENKGISDYDEVKNETKSLISQYGNKSHCEQYNALFSEERLEPSEALEAPHFKLSNRFLEAFFSEQTQSFLEYVKNDGNPKQDPSKVASLKKQAARRLLREVNKTLEYAVGHHKQVLQKYQKKLIKALSLDEIEVVHTQLLLISQLCKKEKQEVVAEKYNKLASAVKKFYWHKVESDLLALKKEAQPKSAKLMLDQTIKFAEVMRLERRRYYYKRRKVRNFRQFSLYGPWHPTTVYYEVMPNLEGKDISKILKAINDARLDNARQTALQKEISVRSQKINSTYLKEVFKTFVIEISSKQKAKPSTPDTTASELKRKEGSAQLIAKQRSKVKNREKKEADPPGMKRQTTSDRKGSSSPSKPSSSK